jgi:putative ABC transport system permease protein
MNALQTLWSKLRSLAQRREVKQEIDEELRFHIEQRTAENIAAGMSPEDAAREARKRFGNLQSVREECREKRGASFGEATLRDLRFGFRQLIKNPGFTAVAVLTLALGIGATTAMFSVVNALLIRPLPFPEPDHLVWIANAAPSGAGLSSETTRAANFLDWRSQNQSFESLAAYFAFFDYGSHTLTGIDEPARLRGVEVSQGFLETLGIRPQLGRSFVGEECQRNGRKAVILTDSLWKRRFQGRPNIVGQSILLKNELAAAAGDPPQSESYLVVGVLPPSFDFASVFAPGSKADMLIPFPINAETDGMGNTLAVVGRLKPGATLAQAQAEFDLLNQRLRDAHPERGRDFAARMTPLAEHVSGSSRRPFLILAGAVGCVLLIACANVANLLLARASARRKEIAVRIALGASRSRLVRQLLTESALLAVLGAGLGLPLAYLATSTISQTQAFNIPLLASAEVDRPALVFTLVVAVTAGFLFGLVPALRLSRPNLHENLKQAGRGSSHGRSRSKFHDILVVGEVAGTCVLLVTAGLLIQSLVKILDVDPGFRVEKAAAWPIQPSRSFGIPAEQTAYFRELIRTIETIPGVESAGLTDTLPMGRNYSWDVAAKGGTYRPGEQPDAYPRIVDENYLQTMQIPLRAGRLFTSDDVGSGGRVVIINEALAQRLWPGKLATGQMLITANSEYEVAGVVGNVRHSGLDKPCEPEMYFLGAQNAWGSQELVVRTTASLAALVPAVRSALRSFDSGMPTGDYRSLSAIVSLAVSPKRLIATTLGIFATVALLLAAIGVYGVLSWSVSQRTPELGVRLALGATPGEILRLVIGQGMKPVVFGVLLGIVVAAALTRLMGSMLFGVSTADLATFCTVAPVLVVVALIACWLPARRAAQVNPIEALRSE